MRKTHVLILGLTIAATLAGAPVVAQSSCEQRRSDGTVNPDYQRCLHDEREQRNRQLVDIYRLQIEAQKTECSFFFGQRRRKADLLWTQANFDIERQIDAAEQRIAYAKIRGGQSADDEARRQSLVIDLLRQRQGLQNRHKDQSIELYNRREQAELTQLELQLARYELSVRGFPVVPL
ncbi:hypothetical protein FJZ27_02515 [Candidatus Peribacteria bacterium]|nr:hypothetical protein [Candidatus Peribacteria bacterium]